MNTGYLIYQAERPRSSAEQRQVDIAHAELARSVSRRWHALTALLGARRRTGRLPGLPAAHRPDAHQPDARVEGLTECLTGHHA
jgi:hypothetical protein